MAHVAVIHERVGGAGGFGSARLVTQLTRGLDRIGHRVTLCCYDQGPSVFDEEKSQVEVRSVLPYLGQDGTSRSTLARYWRGMVRVAASVPSDVDVINAHEWMGLRAGVLAARRTGAPLVWTRSDETFWEEALMPTEGRYSQHSPAMRAARGFHGVSDLVHARQADAIVVTSEHDGDMVRRAYRRPAHVIRQPPPPRFFDAPSREGARADLGLSDDEFFVFSFAIHQPYRRSEDLIEAASRLGDVPGLRVLIAGSDHENPEYVRSLHDLVAARDLGSRVEVRGEAIVDAELRNHMAAADAFVFVSRRQSYGLAPLEAIASRTPVVVSTGAGVSELIGGRPGVFAVPPEDPGAIATSLRAIHAGDGVQGVLETREWLRESMTFERYAQDMTRLFEDAMGPRASTGRAAGVSPTPA